MNETEPPFINSSTSNAYGQNNSPIIKFNLDGKIGKGLTWNQTDTVGNINFSFFNISGNKTFSIWVNLTNVGAGLSSIFEGGIAGGTPFFETNLEVNATGNVIYNSYTSSCLISNVTILSNVSTHIIVTTSNVNSSIYINDTLVARGGDCNDNPSIPAFGLGVIVAGQGRKVPFGTLDEFGYWNRILNSTEISDLWNNGNGLTPDFCEYPGSGNWTIILSNNCVLNTETNVYPKNIVVSGASGSLTINTTITTKSFYFVPSDFNGDAIVTITENGALVRKP